MRAGTFCMLVALVLAPLAGCGDDGGGGGGDGGRVDGGPRPNECFCCDGTVMTTFGSCEDVCGGCVEDGGTRPDSGPGTDGGTPPGCVEDLTPAWVTGAAPGTDVYVSPDGDDGNDGTAASPLRTTSAAFDRLAPGVRLRFAAGTYDCDGAYLEGMNAPRDNPAMIVSDDGPRMAHFDCGGGSGFLFVRVRGLIVDGIELSNTTGHAFQVSSGSPFDAADLSGDIVMTRSYIHDAGLACYKASQAEGLEVHYSECARADPGRQMFEFVAVDAVTLANNEGHSSGPFEEIKGGAMGARVYHNYIHDTDGGLFVGADCTGEQFLVHPEVRYEATDVRVWGNVMENVTSEAFRIVSCHDCVVANNTYYTDDPSVAMRIIASGFSMGGGCDDIPTDNRNLTIVNNVFAATSAYSYMIATNQPTIDGLTMTHNLWFAGSGTDVTGIGSDVAFTGEASSLYSVDPMFAGAPGDLSPAAGSPLLGAGTVVDFVRGGYDGCWDGAPNIGAY